MIARPGREQFAVGRATDRTSALDVLPFDMRDRIERVAHPEDRDEIARTFGPPFPEFVARRLLREWEQRVTRESWEAGNEYARSVRDEYRPALTGSDRLRALPFDATEHDIEAEAERCAEAVRSLAERVTTGHGKEGELANILSRVAASYDVKLPACDSVRGKLFRMVTVGYWKRQLRKRLRQGEEIARRAGLVRKGVAAYVSDAGHERYLRNGRALQRFLASHQAVNLDTGESVDLEELWATSLANPRIRFVGLIKGLQGLKARTVDLGFVAQMLTMTTPSRMHAYLSATSQRNPRFDGTTPATAQRYLCRTWNNAKRALDRLDIRAGRDYFGFRVVEPHHDGTPHWHVLLSCKPELRSEIVATLRAYATADSPDEPGAAAHRFDVKNEDPTKGDFVGYMVAYLAKATDGSHVGEDNEAGTEASDSAPRAVAWARTHGLRQFAFFGVGAVTPFRELFRLDRLPASVADILGGMYDAAKAGDFGAYLKAAATTPARLRVYRAPEPSPSFPGEITQRLRGVTVEGDSEPVHIITRPDTWAVGRREKSAVDSPWTRFNNSAHLDSVEEFETCEPSETSPAAALERQRVLMMVERDKDAAQAGLQAAEAEFLKRLRVVRWPIDRMDKRQVEAMKAARVAYMREEDARRAL